MTDSKGHPQTRRECLAWLESQGVASEDAITIYRLIGFAFDAGLSITLNNGGDADEVEDITDRPALVWEMVATDEDVLKFRDQAGRRCGFVHLVYGNEPGEIICDHTASPLVDGLVEQAEARA